MTKNGKIVDSTNVEAANAYMDMDTQFDDVLPEPIQVTLVEYVTEEYEENGKLRQRRRPARRTALINTYVPMRVLHSMMASQEKLRRLQNLQKEVQDGQVSSGGQQAMIEWMTEQVLAVWKLTEPDMTAEALADGLSFQKVFGLFKLFFGDLLASMNRQKLT